MIHWLEHTSRPGVAVLGIGAALLFELGTMLLRFVLGLRSAESTSWLAPFTFGVRVHHGFVGLAFLLLAVSPVGGLFRRVLVVVGIMLALSDALHHFVVLPATVGATEFDLLYPPPPPSLEP